MVAPRILAAVLAGSLALVGVASAHNESFSDPDDSIHPGDLKRVRMSHGGGSYSFVATMWDDFSNRSMKPGVGVSWELDTVDAAGKFEFDHQIVLNWMRHNGRKQYRCRVLRESNGNFVGNFPGTRNGRTLKCPDIPDSRWGNRQIFDWNVLSFHEGGLDSSGAHEH